MSSNKKPQDGSGRFAYDGLDRVIHERARLSIVILDACRVKPFRGARSGAKGWAAMATASGSFIAFATAPNATASDNRRGAGPPF